MNKPPTTRKELSEIIGSEEFRNIACISKKVFARMELEGILPENISETSRRKYYKRDAWRFRRTLFKWASELAIHNKDTK